VSSATKTYPQPNTHRESFSLGRGWAASELEKNQQDWKLYLAAAIALTKLIKINSEKRVCRPRATHAPRTQGGGPFFPSYPLTLLRVGNRRESRFDGQINGALLVDAPLFLLNCNRT